MQFHLQTAIDILERTPASLQALVSGLGEEWSTVNEGEGSWSAVEVVAHLIYLDKINWLHRAKLLLVNDEEVRFEPLDRTGGKNLSDELTMTELLITFQQTRKEVLQEIRQLHINEKMYSRTEIHPDFGEVKLSQLLSAWVVHDLSHISQVCRIMAKQYKEEVGPWKSFLRILN
jgi:hypothetical protein